VNPHQEFGFDDNAMGVAAAIEAKTGMGCSNLSAVAPTSSNPSIVSVPPEVNVPAGALYADFPVVPNSEGQATISALLNNGGANG